MDVWWGNFLPQPELDKDPRLDQLAALKLKLKEAEAEAEEAKKVAASLTPKSAATFAASKYSEYARNTHIPAESPLSAFQLTCKSVLVVHLGDSDAMSLPVANALAAVGGKVLIADKEAGVAGAWVKELAGGENGKVLTMGNSGAGRKIGGVQSSDLAREGVGVDVVVLCMHVNHEKTSINGTNWTSELNTQLQSAKDVFEAVVPGMQMRRWGRVLVVASGESMLEGSSVLKGAVSGLVSAWSSELANHGVTCNALLCHADKALVKKHMDAIMGPLLLLTSGAGGGINGSAIQILGK